MTVDPNAPERNTPRVGFMWQKKADQTVEFQGLRFIGLLVLFVALMIAGIIAEHEKYGGASNVLYGAAGATFTALLGATVIEKLFR